MFNGIIDFTISEVFETKLQDMMLCGGSDAAIIPIGNLFSLSYLTYFVIFLLGTAGHTLFCHFF